MKSILSLLSILCISSLSVFAKDQSIKHTPAVAMSTEQLHKSLIGDYSLSLISDAPESAILISQSDGKYTQFGITIPKDVKLAKGQGYKAAVTLGEHHELKIVIHDDAGKEIASFIKKTIGLAMIPDSSAVKTASAIGGASSTTVKKS